MEIVRKENSIRIYNNGVLIIEDTSYNNIVLIIDKLKKVILDVYQLNVLNEVLKRIELSVVA